MKPQSYLTIGNVADENHCSTQYKDRRSICTSQPNISVILAWEELMMMLKEMKLMLIVMIAEVYNTTAKRNARMYKTPYFMF